MSRSIGFIGIGNMGRPMARNLVQAGHKVIVYDVNPEISGQFAAEFDARPARDLSDLGRTAGIVITMLPTGKDVREVMLHAEQGGLVETLKPGSLLIDMSSSDPLGTRELGEELAGMDIQFVDAPVSGGVPGAENATLAIMIGSDDPDALQRARPILECMGKNLFETGPLGSGHAMKCLNNYVAGAGYIAISEALIAGKNFGLEPEVIVNIINSSTGRSFNSEFTFVSHVLKEQYTTGFKLALCNKDIKIAADLGEGLGLDLPMTRVAAEMWQKAHDGMDKDSDFTEAYSYWESTIKPE